MDRALYILSGNLSTTPRALKSILKFPGEADIYYVNRSDTWLAKDKELIAEHKLNVRTKNLGRRPLMNWLVTSAFHYFTRIIYPGFSDSSRINAYASEKASILLRLIYKTRHQYKLIAGHGYGSLYPSWKLSKKRKIPFMFDVEDYHPGEYIRRDAKNERLRREFLLRKLLPEAFAVTFASPLIAEKTVDLCGPLIKQCTILNYFPNEEYLPPAASDEFLKLVWYSQRIASGRGLEIIYKALQVIEKDLWQLTLIGELDHHHKSDIPPDIKDRIEFLPVMGQRELHSSLSKFHVGLAVESDIRSENRNLCLSNKILTYFQAGLFILATDTSAQKLFIEEDPDRGIICGQSPADMKAALEDIINRKDQITGNALRRYEKSKSFGWNKESEKLQEIWIDLFPKIASF